MESKTGSRAPAKLNCARLAAALFFLSAFNGPAQETSWRLLVEPQFMRPAFSKPIEGSSATLLAYAVQRGGELEYLSQPEYDRVGVDLGEVDRMAAENASSELAKLKPRFVRNRQSVIEFAVIESPSPLTASTVLAPDFSGRFEQTLGPDLLVAIPSRNRIYIFPKQASRFREAADLVLRDYETAIYPVSREVFEIRSGRLRAIGEYGQKEEK